ncbi:glutamate [NMDA] receptor subunit 1-like [Gordionus sp. m RMFG-2023]|uniref:glutamate [NMDA] receptor subunit 1-like n=1 Tax=Gordionus sp. m RMFG-2023 TaxID=3053472 RepID=UPI0031FD1272
MSMFWSGFTMIIATSYTANLAAFLVLDRPEQIISEINDPRLRNPNENFSFATIQGSDVDLYFRRQGDLSNVYRKMSTKSYSKIEQAIKDIKIGKLQAFIWESSRLQYEVSKDCNLVISPQIFGMSGYGIAMKRGNLWLPLISKAILNFHETGIMEKIDKEWINVKNVSSNCKVKENQRATLGVSNMLSVFILIFAGILVGYGMLSIEIIWKKYQNKKKRRYALAQSYFERWRINTLRNRKVREATNENEYSMRI